MQLEKAFRTAPVTLLLGPRQCGKTTLARNFEGRPDSHWFDLHNYLHRSQLEDNPMGILGPLRGLVILDEVQVLPDLFRLLRVLADRPEQPARFLLLGSASPDLNRHSAETLAGRNYRIEMSGFSAGEVGVAQQARLWLRGGFPKAFTAPDDGLSFKWRRDFISDFLERDLPALVDLRLDSGRLRRLLLLLASHHGQAVNASALGRDLGADFKTVQRYLDVMEGAYMARSLPPFSTNVAKRVRKTPRTYLRDTGILHALLGLETVEQFETSGRMGFSWEGFCIEHLIAEGVVDPQDCFHYSVQSGAEMDLVARRNGEWVGFEFKHNAVPKQTKSMRVAADDLELKQVYLVYPGPDSFPMDPDGRFQALSWKDISTLADTSRV